MVHPRFLRLIFVICTRRVRTQMLVARVDVKTAAHTFADTGAALVVKLAGKWMRLQIIHVAALGF
jgi:hypothetical protein